MSVLALKVCVGIFLFAFNTRQFQEGDDFALRLLSVMFKLYVLYGNTQFRKSLSILLFRLNYCFCQVFSQKKVPRDDTLSDMALPNRC